MHYTLMNKDVEVVGFSTVRTEYDSVRIDKTKILNPQMVPVEYKGDMLRFIDKRKAPKHRKYIQSLLRQLGAEDIEGFIRVSNGASLTDTFWIRDEDNPKTWREVSLYQNDFDENIAKIAFEGGSGELGATTPELSVDGNFAKCWIREDKQLYLLKRGSETYGREPFAEFYASQLAAILCPKSVEYELVKHHNVVATKCEIFTSEYKGFSQIMHFVDNPNHVTIKEALAIIKKYGDENEFRRMMVLDALILNIDRHLGNFGLLMDNDTQTPIGMAPVFDHNRSMLFNLSDSQFAAEDMDTLIDLYPRIAGEFNENAYDMLTDEIRNDLRNLKGFTFRMHGEMDWPMERLAKYEMFINRQIGKILKREKLFISRFK